MIGMMPSKAIIPMIKVVFTSMFSIDRRFNVIIKRKKVIEMRYCIQWPLTIMGDEVLCFGDQFFIMHFNITRAQTFQ